ncbi:MAG: bifunctional diaminohydroxyphosphoribosylaminopyrimidine deaminase/5-amino-6-(5-phosphoribosylamino)uracil reductase RibD [Chthoniobacteraceae bacterium]
MTADEKFMRAALREAAKGIGQTSPNPAVGAVIVRGGRIVARGWHRRAGGPHAEIEAIRAAKTTRGATLYVTLEPCSTHGRTPPCCDAIRAAGFGRVVIGAIDPNPKHAGRGVEILREAKIKVQTGVLGDECAALNRAFNKWIVTGMPWVIAKAGMSLDGRLTRPAGEGQWLTSEKSRAHAMGLRAAVDAILVGAGTLRADDPKLTLRGVEGRQPWRVILTRSGRLPKAAHVFTDSHKERTLVYRGESLRAVLRDLGKRSVTSVLIEGGGAVLGDAFDRRLVDEVHFYFAPLLCGGPDVIGGRGARCTAESLALSDVRYEHIGGDLHLAAFVR